MIFLQGGARDWPRRVGGAAVFALVLGLCLAPHRARAAIFASADGTVAAHLSPGHYPLLLRFGKHNAARLQYDLLATSPTALAMEDKLVFLAQNSQKSGRPMGQTMLCAAASGELSCRRSPFVSDSPLKPADLKGVVLGFAGPPQAREALAFEPATGRLVSQSTPLPAVDLAVAEGYLAVLTGQGPGAAIQLFAGGAAEGPPTPCAGCEAVFSLGRFQEWVLVVGRPPGPPGATPGGPGLPGVGSAATVRLALFSTARGTLMPPQDFLFAPPPPPALAGVTPRWRLHTLHASEDESRHLLCLEPLGCREIAVSPGVLSVSQGVTWVGRQAAPLAAQRWLSLIQEGPNVVLEWLGPGADLLSSLPLPLGMGLVENDARHCQWHGCKPWRLEETPFNTAPVSPGVTVFSPAAPLALAGGDGQPLVLYEKGLQRARWSGPAPAAPPVTVAGGVVVFAQKSLAVFSPDKSGPLFKASLPAAPGGAAPVYFLPPGKKGLWFSRGRLMAHLGVKGKTWKLRKILALPPGARWLGSGRDGFWATGAKNLWFFPAATHPLKTSRRFQLGASGCRLHTDGAGAVSLCADVLATHPLRGRGVRLRLPPRMLPVRGLWASPTVIYLAHRASDSAQSPLALKVFSREGLVAGAPMPLLGVNDGNLPDMALVPWQGGACLFSLPGQVCLTPSGQSLSVFVDPLGQATPGLLSRLGLGAPTGHRALLRPLGQMERTFAFPGGVLWSTLSSVSIERGHLVTKPEWQYF